MPEPQLEQDNAALEIPLDQLGWVGSDPNDPEAQK